LSGQNLGPVAADAIRKVTPDNYLRSPPFLILSKT